MKFSVAMCTYNGAAHLPEQLRSIAAQTRPPDELVVCDDKSADGTKEIVAEFASRAPFPVRLHVNEENLGSTRNFEKAIGLCAGEIIALADQDDVWHPDKLRRMEDEFIAAPHVGLVFTDLEVVDEDLRPLGYRAWQCDWVEFGRREQQLFRRGRELDVLLTRNVVTGSALAFRAEFKNLIVPIPNISRLEIHDQWIALIIAAVAGVAFIDEPLVQYRRHTGQQMGLLPPVFADATGWSTAWRRADAYPVIARLLGPLCERLRRENHDGRYGERIAELEARLTHALARESLPAQKFVSRAWYALKELVTLRYQRFPHPNSNGFYDAAKDLLPYRILHLISRRANASERTFQPPTDRI